jgi:uncharacterized protein
MSSLKECIQEDMKTALRAHDKPRLSVIRMILAAIKQVEVDERKEVNDAEICQILNKMLKQRGDAIDQYIQAKRDDLVEQERFEETVIKTYLPEPLTEGELDPLISQVIVQTDARSMKDMGRVMAELKHQCQGRADIALLSAKVKQRLSNL